MASATASGSPAAAVYSSSTAATGTGTGVNQETLGVVLTVDYDGVTGLHDITIDTAIDPAFFAAGNDYDIILTAGTVNGTSIAGTLVGTFSLLNRSALCPAVPDRRISVAADGAAESDLRKIDGTTVSTSSAQIGVNVVNAAGTAWNSGAISASTLAADTITDAKVAADVTIASVTGSVGSVTGNVGGNVTGSVGSISTGGITAASFAAGAIDSAAIATDAIGSAELAASAISEIQSGLSTLTAADIRSAVGLASANLDTQLSTIAGYIDTEVASILAAVDTEVAAIKLVTDKLDDTLETDPTGTAGVYRFTINSLESVWDATTASHLQSGTTGASLNAAGSAGDPWTTSLPGAYGAGTAGYLIGTNLDTTVSSRASQTSLDTLDDYVDTEVAAIKAKTDSLTFTTAGRVDCQVFGMQADTLTSSALATSAVTEIQSGLSTLDAAGVRTAVGLASANLDTQLAAIAGYIDTEVAAIKAKTDNLPTDPADASDIAASFSTVNSTLATIAGYIDTEVAAIKAKTDSLTFSTAGRVDAQVYGMEAGTLTATAVATGAIDADALATDAANEIADALLDRTAGVETNRTVRQTLRLMLAALVGKLSGAATTSVVIRDTNDSVNRVTATVDADGNRSAVTLDAS